jgi:hypothetical protein
MSARMTGLVFAHYRAGGNELVMALALADEAKDDGTNVRPGVEALMRKTRQSRATVCRQLRRMVEQGWLLVVDAPHGRGESAFTEYRIDPLWIAKFGGDCPSTEGATDQPLRSQIETSKSQLRSQIETSSDNLRSQIETSKSGLRSQIETSSRVFGGGKGGVLSKVLIYKEIHVGDCLDPNDTALKKDADLCIWMLGLIRENVNARHGDPRNWRRWLDAVRLMRTQDKRSHREIAELFKWANADAFWKANILSPTKLREKWDQLVARRNSTAGTTNGAPLVHSKACRHAGCGAKGTRSFSIDGSDWWCNQHYEQQQLVREGVTN